MPLEEVPCSSPRPNSQRAHNTVCSLENHSLFIGELCVGRRSIPRPNFASVRGGQPKTELRREAEDRLSATVMAVFYHAHSQASSIVSARLVHERIALLPRRCVRRARSRQLQHRCVLAFAQPGEQYGFPVGELQRIVMHARLAHVDLPELRHFLLESPEFHDRERSKKALVPDALRFYPERVETKRGNGAQGMYGAQGSDLFPLWISERSRARNIGSPYRRLCPVKWLRPAEASLTEFQNDYQ